MRRLHTESHLVERIGWLRAALLGANDGIISTSSLILGVASAAASKSDVLLSGVAGLVAVGATQVASAYCRESEYGALGIRAAEPLRDSVGLELERALGGDLLG